MRLISLGLFWSIASTGFAQDTGKNSDADHEPPGKPPLVRSGYQQLPSSSAIIDYLQHWAAASKHAAYIQLGESAGGRPIGGLLISADEAFLKTVELKTESRQDNPLTVTDSAERLRVMIVGGQHGNETASPEAVQQVIYQMLAGELRNYPHDMDFIIIPNASPDGRDLQSRENADGVNTNTDYILLSQPEGRALRQALTVWQPHTVLDVHESTAYKEDSLAQQGYVTVFEIQYEVGFEPNIDTRLRQFGVNEFLPGLIEKAGAKHLHARRYIKEIYDVNQPITHGGITLRNFRNYAGFHDTFSVLVEGRIDPPDSSYPTPLNIKDRTDELSRSIEAYLEQVRDTADRIRTLTGMARSGWKGLAEGDQLALESEYGIDPDQTEIIIPLREIGTDDTVNMEFEYHGRVVMIDSLLPPPAYVVTKYQDLIATLLDRHGIAYRRVEQPFRFDGVSRSINNLEVVPPPRGKGRYEVRFKMMSESGQIEVVPGDLWVDVNQPGGRLVPLLLEPRSSTSIYEEKDYINILSEGRFFVIPLGIQPAKAWQALSDQAAVKEK